METSVWWLRAPNLSVGGSYPQRLSLHEGLEVWLIKT